VSTGPDEAISDPVARVLDGCAATGHLWPEQEEGPYRRGDQPCRRDVTEGRAGTPLALGLCLRTDQGDALADAEVEIWHCDALGRYSGYPPPDPTAVVTAETAARAEYLPDETFLRGRQPADAAGRVEFRTIYPGWYPGRTVHIHLMVHARGRTWTSQAYFPEDATRAVFTRPPYRERPTPDTTNDTDEIYPTGGEPAVLEVIDQGERGYLAALCLVLPEASQRG
jgi:protocatechuate 3,4-dioxygenase beta subunit